MIQQFIFAAPKPGMTEAAFQDYWVNVHAVKYASKIPGITKYSVDTRVQTDPVPNPFPGWGGVAEIWFPNEQTLLASLQTPQFIDGARMDEPRWAAFWLTLAINTDPTVVVEGPPMSPDDTDVKVFVLMKRRGGVDLAGFRDAVNNVPASCAEKIPGLLRCVAGFTRDDAYAIGEAPLDLVLQLSFRGVEQARSALDTDAYRNFLAHLATESAPRYTRTFVAKQHWIIF
jgi:EthD domain